MTSRAPSVVLGYLNNDKANQETFQDGYMRTGDEAVVRKAPSGNEHVFIVDRIKELIKVQVRLHAPSDLSHTYYCLGTSSRASRTRGTFVDASCCQ
jgi:acyl-CoA synthetase (AMP-forming)/AMP-acid ligase II